MSVPRFRSTFFGGGEKIDTDWLVVVVTRFGTFVCRRFSLFSVTTGGRTRRAMGSPQRGGGDIEVTKTNENISLLICGQHDCEWPFIVRICVHAKCRQTCAITTLLVKCCGWYKLHGANCSCGNTTTTEGGTSWKVRNVRGGLTYSCVINHHRVLFIVTMQCNTRIQPSSNLC